MPAGWKTLQRPGARRAFRQHHVAGLECVQDATAIEYRVRGLERIVITFSDMALEVFKLPLKVDFDLSPGGHRNDLVWLSPIQVHVLSRVPMCSMNRPASVTPLVAKRVTRDLAPTRVVDKEVPGIPIDANLAANHGVGLVDAPPDLFIQWMLKNSVSIEVSSATRPVGKGRSAVRPQCDEIVAEDRFQLVA
jgi:hypothetical protein